MPPLPPTKPHRAMPQAALHCQPTSYCHCHALVIQAAAVLGEIAAVDPAEYERQQNTSGEKAGVRSVAAFVKEMAAQLPRCGLAGLAGVVPLLRHGCTWHLHCVFLAALSQPRVCACNDPCVRAL